MNKRLCLQAVVKFAAGLALTALLIFLSAGTAAFWNGWLFLAVLFVPMLVIGVVLSIKNPALLASRLDAKETQGAQKTVIAVSGLLFISAFVLAGLNFRFQWLMLPDWLCITAAVVFLLGYAMYAEVLRENTYLSRTVEVQQDQQVIDTGLYGFVRHPMYTSSVLMFLSAPLILGSLLSFLILLVYPLLLVVRIKNEEKLLTEELSGYSDYCRKVKYRMIPFVW